MQKLPLYFLVVACIMNIVLDFVFIAGLGMGVEEQDRQFVSPIFSAIACVVYLEENTSVKINEKRT